MAGRVGRPKMPKEQRRDVSLKVSLSRAEYEAVLRAAEADGRKASDWARRLILVALRKQ